MHKLVPRARDSFFLAIIGQSGYSLGQARSLRPSHTRRAQYPVRTWCVPQGGTGADPVGAPASTSEPGAHTVPGAGRHKRQPGGCACWARRQPGATPSQAPTRCVRVPAQAHRVGTGSLRKGTKRTHPVCALDPVGLLAGRMLKPGARSCQHKRIRCAQGSCCRAAQAPTQYGRPTRWPSAGLTSNRGLRPYPVRAPASTSEPGAHTVCSACNGWTPLDTRVPGTPCVPAQVGTGCAPGPAQARGTRDPSPRRVPRYWNLAAQSGYRVRTGF